MAKPSVDLWMPLYLERHRAATSTMTHIEHSAFVYLTMLLWESGGRIADDDRQLARRLRLSARQWQAARDAVLQPFKAASGFITDPEMIAEIERRQGIVERRREAGRASANARSNGNTCSTRVEQTANTCATTRDLTSNLYQENSSGDVELHQGPFRVFDGGAA